MRIMLPHFGAARPAVAALLASSAPLAAPAADEGGGTASQLLADVASRLGLNSFGLLYALACAGIYATIYLQGRGNVVYRGGVIYKDGKPVVQERPFDYTADEAAKAAAAALQNDALAGEDGGAEDQEE